MNIEKRLKAGIAAHRKGRHVVAADAYRDVLKADPENADALHFFGMLLFHLGDREKGMAAVRKSLSINNHNAAAHSNLGNMLLTVERPGDAAESYRAALSVDPLHSETYRNFGVLLRRIGKIEEAIETLEQAAEIDGDNLEVWHNLGISYLAVEELEKAADAFEKCAEQGLDPGINAVWHARILCSLGREEAALEHLGRHLKKHPNDPVALHHIASIKGETSDKVPEAYVKEHFDTFSKTFNDQLRDLQYRAPELVAEEVAAWRKSTGRDRARYAVDLGCGTGLCGPLMRDHCWNLIGVDLSPKMLRKAADVGAYSELHEEELVRFLKALDDGSVDLAISADTLNYLGDLTPLLTELARTLAPGAALVATFEDAGDDRPEVGYRLQNHGRYCHARSYIDQVVADAGLIVARDRVDTLRRETKKEVTGLILTIAQPEG